MLVKSSFLFLSLGAALELVLGSSVDIYYPKSNTVLKTGSTVHIKWHVNDKSVGPIRLQYATGKPTSLNIKGVIADNVDASLGSYTWKIPSNMEAKKYVLEAGPSASDLSFAGYVVLKKGKTTKKHNTKKNVNKKHSASAVCFGYPSKDNEHERVRCHSVPRHSAKKSKKSTKKTYKKKTTKRTTKKTTIKHKSTTS